MNSTHIRILIERETRSGNDVLAPEKVAETAVAALLQGTEGRLHGFNVENYRWIEKSRSAHTVALSSLVEGWDAYLEEKVRSTLAGLCRELDQEAITLALSPADSFLIKRNGGRSRLLPPDAENRTKAPQTT